MRSPCRIFRVDDIAARVVAHDWRFAAEKADAIAEHWRAILRQRPSHFDGRVFLLARHETVENDGRAILLSEHFETRFSAFIAWRDWGWPDLTVKNGFAMAALRGNDGGFVLAEMGAGTSNAGLVYFPAGTPDPDDVVGDTLDLRGSVLRELEEETGLAPREVSLATDWTIIDAGPRFACMKLARVDAPASELSREIDRRIAQQTAPELARTCVVHDAGDIDAARMPDFVIAYLEHMFAGA